MAQCVQIKYRQIIHHIPTSSCIAPPLVSLQSKRLLLWLLLRGSLQLLESFLSWGRFQDTTSSHCSRSATNLLLPLRVIMRPLTVTSAASHMPVDLILSGLCFLMSDVCLQICHQFHWSAISPHLLRHTKTTIPLMDPTCSSMTYVFLSPTHPRSISFWSARESLSHSKVPCQCPLMQIAPHQSFVIQMD